MARTCARLTGPLWYGAGHLETDGRDRVVLVRLGIGLPAVEIVSRPHRRPLEIQVCAKSFESTTPRPLEETLPNFWPRNWRHRSRGWTVAQEFTDHAISGATLLRSGFQALMRNALNRRFELVLAESLDRFSRDQDRPCTSASRGR